MTATRKSYEPVRLQTGRRWLVYCVGLGVWLTGVVCLVCHYFLRIKTTFGPAPNPLEPWSLAAHGAFAFATLWLFGMLWGHHIVGAWKSGRHQLSGALLLTFLLVLVVSGYLLYYAGGDETRSIVSVVHWGLGLVLPAPFLIHRFRNAIQRRKNIRV